MKNKQEGASGFLHLFIRNDLKLHIMKSTSNRLHILILFTLSGLFTASCGPDSLPVENMGSVTKTHYNILLASDLSNRINNELYPRAINDQTIINSFVDLINPTILRNKRKTQQKDKYRVIFTNQKVVQQHGSSLGNLQIDFEQFGNKQAERIQYINGKADQSFNQDKKAFIETFGKIYQEATINPKGADIWSFFQSGISDIHVEKQLPDSKISDGTICKNIYKNVLILMTDGYLEAGIYGSDFCKDGRHCPFLNYARIQEFRAAFKQSGQADMKAFIKASDFGITPVNNPNLKELEVIVMEMYDRSLDKAGNATVHPSDYEILQIFWEDWLEESGVKNYSFRPCLSTREEVDRVLKDFIL
jgi:hypothetical protein